MLIPLLAPAKRMVPFEAVEPTLTLPETKAVVTPAKVIRSDVPPTNSLFEMVMFSSYRTPLLKILATRIELLTWPLKRLLSITAFFRPKLTWIPLPDPAPGLLLFWIRLNWAVV